MILFHGTGKDFNKFDLKMVNTGEEVQKFGHGIYLTSSEEEGKYYAERAAEKGFVHQVKANIKSNQIIHWEAPINAQILKACQEAVIADPTECFDKFEDYNNTSENGDIYDYDDLIDSIVFNKNRMEADELLDELKDKHPDFDFSEIDNFLSRNNVNDFEFDDEPFSSLYGIMKHRLDGEKQVSEFLKAQGYKAFVHDSRANGFDSKIYTVFDTSVLDIEYTEEFSLSDFCTP